MPGKWIREESLFNKGPAFKLITYTNSINPNLIESLQITKWKHSISSEEIRLRVILRDGASRHLRYNALRDQLIAAGFKDNGSGHSCRYNQNPLLLENTDSFGQVLAIVGEYEEISAKDHDDILMELGIKKSECQLAEELSGLVEKGQFDAAVKLAKEYQAVGYNKVVWELVLKLHENCLVDPVVLIDLYSAIAPNNPYYSEAQGRLVVLYGETELDKNRGLALSLGAAINSGEQRLVDQLFHRLCGRHDMTPTFINVKGDASTLVALAAHIRQRP